MGLIYLGCTQGDLESSQQACVYQNGLQVGLGQRGKDSHIGLESSQQVYQNVAQVYQNVAQVGLGIQALHCSEVMRLCHICIGYCVLIVGSINLKQLTEVMPTPVPSWSLQICLLSHQLPAG